MVVFGKLIVIGNNSRENYKRKKIKIAYKSIDTNDNELLRA